MKMSVPLIIHVTENGERKVFLEKENPCHKENVAEPECQSKNSEKELRTMLVQAKEPKTNPKEQVKRKLKFETIAAPPELEIMSEDQEVMEAKEKANQSNEEAGEILEIRRATEKLEIEVAQIKKQMKQYFELKQVEKQADLQLDVCKIAEKPEVNLTPINKMKPSQNQKEHSLKFTGATEEPNLRRNTMHIRFMKLKEQWEFKKATEEPEMELNLGIEKMKETEKQTEQPLEVKTATEKSKVKLTKAEKQITEAAKQSQLITVEKKPKIQIEQAVKSDKCTKEQLKLKIVKETNMQTKQARESDKPIKEQLKLKIVKEPNMQTKQARESDKPIKEQLKLKIVKEPNMQTEQATEPDKSTKEQLKLKIVKEPNMQTEQARESDKPIKEQLKLKIVKEPNIQTEQVREPDKPTKKQLKFKIVEEPKIQTEQARQPGKPTKEQSKFNIVEEEPKIQTEQATEPDKSTKEQLESEKAHPSNVKNVMAGLSNLVTVDNSVSCQGKSDERIEIITNCIKLEFETKKIFEYEVEFVPYVDSIKLRRTLLKEITPCLCTPLLFDDVSKLYLQTEIRSKTYPVRSPFAKQDKIQVKINFNRCIIGSDVDYLNVCNAVLEKIMYTVFDSKVDKKFFKFNDSFLVAEPKLRNLLTYAINVTEGELGLMCCLNIEHVALSLKDAIAMFLQFQEICHDERKDDMHLRKLFHDHIVGSTVVTDYDFVTYTVINVAWDMTPSNTFTASDGKEISILNYLKKQYGKRIQYSGQFLLICKPNVTTNPCKQKEEVQYLLPELCFITGVSTEQKNNPEIMKHFNLTPSKRITAIHMFFQKIEKSLEAKQILSEWGLVLAQNSLNLNACKLSSEIIYFAENAISYTNQGYWNDAIFQYKIVKSVMILNWIVVYAAFDADEANIFVTSFRQLGFEKGCCINPPKMIALPNNNSNSFINACKENIEISTQIIIFIIPAIERDVYSIIKKYCCTKFPVPSQFIVSETIKNSPNLQSTINSIALKIICKVGGMPWMVQFPFKTWMICGLHTLFTANKKAVHGFVASINPRLSQWYNHAEFQENETNDDFIKLSLTKGLDAYRKENEEFPSTVVIIRSGLNENQLNYCTHELEIANEVINGKGDGNIKLCYIITQEERIKKVFMKDSGTVPLGTVINHSITRIRFNEFFLVLNKNYLTHFIVLQNKYGLAAEEIHKLCYKLCHLYSNYSGITDMPAPCKYAKKLASLVGEYIGESPNEALSKTMFYL